MLDITLKESDLEKIRSSAISLYKESSNPAIESHLQATLCHIKAFILFLQASGHNIALSEPTRPYYDPRDYE